MGGDEFDKTPVTVRIYRGDRDVLNRRVRAESVERDRDMTTAELLHELLATVRLEDRIRR